MRTFVAGEDIMLVVPFTRDGEPFVPDVGSVKWTLRNQAGSKVIGFIGTALTTDTSTTEVTFTVPAAQNALDPDSRFEKRVVVVTGLLGGHPFEIMAPYRLIPWLNHSVNEDAVRAYVGADSQELPDAMIDVPAAYFAIENRIGQTELAAALQSGTLVEQAANRAIVAQAVVALLPSLRQRLLTQQSDGALKFQRSVIDVAAVEAAARGDIQTSIDMLSTATEVNLELLVIPTLVDPITGA